MTNHHKVNYVEELEIDGCVVKGNEDLREWVKSYFTKLYSEDLKWRPRFDGLTFNLYVT